MYQQHWMRALITQGVVSLPALRWRDRSKIGRHWNAVQAFLRTGDTSLLREFEGEEIGGFRLETDPDAIEEWWRQRELDFLDIYES
jgi:hypothetical protein